MVWSSDIVTIFLSFVTLSVKERREEREGERRDLTAGRRPTKGEKHKQGIRALPE